MFGLGLFRCYNFFRADYYTAVFAVYRIIVFDARSNTVVADASADLHLKVGSSLWPGDYQEMSADQVRRLGERLEALVFRNLPRTLTKLNFKR